MGKSRIGVSIYPHLPYEQILAPYTVKEAEDYESEPQLDLEQTLVEYGKQQYTIDGLRDRVKYQEAQVPAAMCFLRTVQVSYLADDGTDSEATTIQVPNCTCEESCREVRGYQSPNDRVDRITDEKLSTPEI
ncbi:hypothetical protein TSTA_011920 [Talaromyces stipitatus ATCC 10500]|uniref:Uncharacterized protein n=1 Tax=Talaromyces stipitatus (strain ATCC 10500 / CBS 375.48 / QM 6759 / NRRL 1006) TaxID=441959 RepID=B8ME06_TALSN|nr:uncharacterized protein TSTA_011920 [Talaromyces stipitatus ATCC 10500]EED16083.1 hypothetical protein TSTA_011920 [Talaromyces stipitatus ATCC 10500]